MLTLALGATLVGFVLLILGLITGKVWLAVACIVICLIGLVFLLIDVIGSGRRRDSGRTIEDMVPGAGDESDDRDAGDQGGDDQGGDDRGADDHRGDDRGVDDHGERHRDSSATTRFGAAGGFTSGDADPAGPHSGRHAALGAQPDTQQASDSGYPTPTASSADPRSGVAPYESRYAQQDSRRDGDLDDYLRSVGGRESGTDAATGTGGTGAGDTARTETDDAPTAAAGRGGQRQVFPQAGDQTPATRPDPGSAGGHQQYSGRPYSGQQYSGQQNQGQQNQGQQNQGQQNPGQQNPGQQNPGRQYPDQQSQQPHPAPWPGTGRPDQSGHPAPGTGRAESPAGEPGEQSRRETESAAEKFDPLDPRWRPPLD